MNLITVSATYIGEVVTERGLRFIHAQIPSSSANNAPAPLYIVLNRAAGETFDAFSEGCQLLINGRLYPNRNDLKMYVVPTQSIQTVAKDLNINQVNLSGGVGYIAEQRIEDVFNFSMMCNAPGQLILNHTYQDRLGFRIESWGDDAKRLSSLLYVGRQLSVGGSLRYSIWQTKEGEQRGTYQVRVRAAQYCLFGKNQPKTEAEPTPSVVGSSAPRLPMQQTDGIPF